MTTYPITLPTQASSQPINTTFRIRRVIGQSQSPFTGETQTFRHQGEWWEAEVTLPPMTHANAREWVAKLVSMRGVFGTMLLGDWDGRIAQGTASSSAGTPLVKGANQAGNTLLIDGATANQTGYLKAGDYIQLGTGISSRLHMVVTDANTDGSGNASLDIEPALRTSPLDNLAITVANTKGVFRLVSNITEWDTNAIRVYGISFSITEYLS